MNQDAGGGTFLTGLGARKQAKSAQKKRSSTNTSVAESDSHIDEEELRDQVFDYDQSKHVLEMAQDFLKDDTKSITSGASKKSSGSIVNENKKTQGQYAL